jgi:phosphatidate cytidylyltransferase
MLALRNGMLASYLTGAFQNVMLEPARFFVFLLVFSTWASDTFAFAAGKAVGKNKLCPIHQPGKDPGRRTGRVYRHHRRGTDFLFDF